MSNFNEDFYEEDEEEHLPNTILSSNGISTLGAGGNNSLSNPMMSKKKRSHPGNPDPNAEVIALSPRTLMATNRYVCEVCHKGFQRDQNLQLHRRGHNLPWKLKQKPTTEVRKRVYVCPEPNCVHHDSSRALGDLTGIKKHFSRKHGEKKWKCDKCSKRYAVQSDWKAHSKICGTREYRCDCGTIFSRKDSFVTHRAFCDALATENYKVNQTPVPMGGMLQGHQAQELLSSSLHANNTCSNTHTMVNLAALNQNANDPMRSLSLGSPGMTFSSCSDDIFNPNASRASSFGVNYLNGLNNGHTPAGSPYMSATALLQKAADMGSKLSDSSISPILLRRFMGYSSSALSSNGSLHEAPSTVNQATTIGLYVANQNFFSKNLEGSINMDSRPDSAVIHGGFVDSPLIVHSEIGEAANSMEGVFTGGSEKMTVDFLGVGPAGNLSLEEGRSCDVDAMGLKYSERQRGVHSEWFAHHS